MASDRGGMFERIHGCLVGLACGDAMGMPTSMMSPDRVRELFPGGISTFRDAPKGHPIHDGLVAGQVTDDTQQALVVANAILEDGKVVPEGIARRLLEWAESINAFGSLLLGPSSLRALTAFREGKSIEESGQFGDTNGASMRIAPVGIINCGDIAKTVDDVALACLPTHNTNIAISGASAVACAIGAGIRGEPSTDSIIEIALEGAQAGMKKGTPWIGASIVRRTELALNLVGKSTSVEQLLRDLYDFVGAGVATTETVPVCLAIFSYCHGDPVESIKLAANLGGDADTIGAIVGAISGAYAGIGSFPREYVDKLEAVNALGLKDLAGKLFDHIHRDGAVD